jgi:S-adenosylmethionine/arginine decarboxylase-like enzyme
MNLVHHHLIYQAKVGRNDLGENAENLLRAFLLALVKEIEMEVLIDPVFKFSHNLAWTGLIGIITSHISFHYWTVEQYVQFDIYSCKEFDVEKAKSFLDKFWIASEQKILFINREPGQDFTIGTLD